MLKLHPSIISLLNCGTFLASTIYAKITPALQISIIHKSQEPQGNPPFSRILNWLYMVFFVLFSACNPLKISSVISGQTMSICHDDQLNKKKKEEEEEGENNHG